MDNGMRIVRTIYVSRNGTPYIEYIDNKLYLKLYSLGSIQVIYGAINPFLRLDLIDEPFTDNVIYISCMANPV